MHALVTTNTCLLLVDIDTESVRKLHTGYLLYYGVTWDENWIYVSVGDTHNLPRAAKDRRPVIMKLDSDLNVVEEMEPTFDTLGAPHQLVYVPELKKLMWVMTNDDCIWVKDYTTAEWSRWVPHPQGAFPSLDKNNHHLNSVFYHDGRVYVLAHNLRFNSQLLAYTPTLDHIWLMDLGLKAHNVWAENGHLHVFSSKEGLVLDDQGNTLYDVGDDMHFLRGYASDGDTRLLGVSWKGPMNERNNHSGHLRVLDKEWSLIKDIDLVSHYGQVFDVRILSAQDTAHNGIGPPIQAGVLV